MTEQQAILSWLKDAHALEVGALPTLQHHAETANSYPEVEAKLLQHLEKTKRHAEQIAGCIERLGGQPSAFKEAVATAVGKVTGLANLPAKDTVVKNALGDYAAENFEIACYKSLIAAAEQIGDQDTADVCKQILSDEEEMAGWLGGHIPSITQQFLSEQNGEDEDSDGALGSVGQTLTGPGEKDKNAAAGGDSRNALLASGALLAGAGAALLIGQALRGGGHKAEQKEQPGQNENAAPLYDDVQAAYPSASGDVETVAETALDDYPLAALEIAEPLEVESDMAVTAVDDALAADLLSMDGAETELVYTEVWLTPGPFSGLGPQSYDSAGDPVGQEIASRLTQHGQVDASNIEITLDNGEVLLEGTVDSEETKRLVGEALEDVSGVGNVQNLLQVQTEPRESGGEL